MRQQSGKEINFVTIISDGINAPSITINPKEDTPELNILALEVFNIIDGEEYVMRQYEDITIEVTGPSLCVANA